MRKPTGRPVGRPPLPEGERLETITLRLTPAQIEKLRALGGRHWVAQRIDRARSTPRQP